MSASFYIVGPTAAGKSDLAAEVARSLGAEIISADAFQIYRGFDLLTAKPENTTLAKAPHHLLGIVSLRASMNAEKFRALALDAIKEIHSCGKNAIVVGGSGLYIKALTHGFAPLPGANRQLRARLAHLSARELHIRLALLDPDAGRTVDKQNARRLIRAIEIRLLTGKSMPKADAPTGVDAHGVFLFREREDLYDRINQRVKTMFTAGVVDEVRKARSIGPTAQQTLGLREIRQLIAGEISEAQCIEKIQQATRRYAKRQLTWFRRQTNFSPLNLSRQGHAEAIEWIAREARQSFAHRDD